MYIQPYEPRDLSLGASSFGGYSAASAATAGESDAIDRSWTDTLPEFGDAEAALDDAPLGEFGLGPMLQNLTGMMQQLVQMMQSLLGRMTGGSEPPGMFGHAEPHRLPSEDCGCTQLPKG
jgi:hypothetical protein